ncbi:hypothetical protein IHE55_21770 [Streptomyces pactum]|uniref:Integral membrane protein n=1 Tax=Streptomyces pactum TaxID=68249 RepID=A0ABS0NQ76_9ACTN|nr:hypothetical protein [Streptomyces pactum]MBH5337247.1 hypothetical protein [Streptomyces pactum]
MLSLRLARGAHPLVLMRRLLVTAASAGASFLLLCMLGYAAGHPEQARDAPGRLVWCLVPLAATVQFAVAVARADQGTRGGPGLTAAGFGPTRGARLAAASTALFCGLGSALALGVFAWLRRFGGDLPSGRLAGHLGRGAHLPLGAVLLLLAVVPALASVTSMVTLWPRRRRRRRPARSGAAEPPPPPGTALVHIGLPWGIALIATGIALETYAGHGAGPSAAELLPLPGRSVQSPPGVIAGWLMAALGLMLAGPGLTQMCGRLLAAGRPGPVRLLAGRALEDEAVRLGRPLGALCAVATAACAVVDLYGGALRSTGPVAGLGAALVMACVTATALTAALEVRGGRRDATGTLVCLGADARLLRRAAVLRGGSLVAVLALVTWLVARVLTLPLTG